MFIFKYVPAFILSVFLCLRFHFDELLGFVFSFVFFMFITDIPIRDKDHAPQDPSRRQTGLMTKSCSLMQIKVRRIYHMLEPERLALVIVSAYI